MLYQRQNPRFNVFLTMDKDRPAQVVPTFLSGVILDAAGDFLEFSKQPTHSEAPHDRLVRDGAVYNAGARSCQVGHDHPRTSQVIRSASAMEFDGLDFLDQSDLEDETRNPFLDRGLTACVKDELKYAIQSKRLKEGKGELKVEFTEPQSDQLTPEEEEKVEKRRVQNRMAARRFRNKQKNQTSALQKECQRLERAHAELRSELAQVRKERDEMRQALETHMASCPLQFPALFHVDFSGENTR